VNGTVRNAVCYRSYHPIFGGLRGSNLQEISKVIQSGLATHPVKLSRQRGGVSGDLYLLSIGPSNMEPDEHMEAKDLVM
jgi:hypothetical protein